MLKHLPPDLLSVIQNDLLYSQKCVNLGNTDVGNGERRHYYALNQANGNFVPDDNFKDTEDKFTNQLKNKYVYRVPLKCICDLGIINFPTKIRLTLKTDMKKLFESKANLNSSLKAGKSQGSTDKADSNVGNVSMTPDAQIVLLKAPMIQYEQLALNTTFRQYLETILYSARTLRMGVQKTQYQKTYELQVGSEDFTIDFQGANRQFDWIEISLVHDRSDTVFSLEHE